MRFKKLIKELELFEKISHFDTLKSTALNQVEIQFENGKLFYSYETPIAAVLNGEIYLEKDYWNFSRTTAKYRTVFLGCSTKELQSKIQQNEIKFFK